MAKVETKGPVLVSILGPILGAGFWPLVGFPARSGALGIGSIICASLLSPKVESPSFSILMKHQ